MKHKQIKLKARWEHDEFPAGKAAQRGLLIEVSGRVMQEEFRTERRPLNLAIVIDRSGSMKGRGRLDAAKQAAMDISRQLRKSDRLSIVAFDSGILVLLDGVRQDRAGREQAQTAISGLQSGGSTDLGGGWMRGARCVAELMEREGLASGHVLLLSDGHANHGVTNPAELGGHAGEMAARGVTSSCIGIGHGYSPLQLDAIAEAGRGQLHHSDNAGEIVDVVLGELGDILKVAAHSASLKLRFPDHVKLQQLTRFPEERGDNAVVLRIGDIPAGRTRRVAFMARVEDGIQAGEHLPVEAVLSWQDAGGTVTRISQDWRLKAVDPAAFVPQAKRRKVARSIAELWVARMGYDAMRLNEGGRYHEAVEAFTCNDILLEDLVAGLEAGVRELLMQRKAKAQAAVSDKWSGPSKLEAFMLAKKLMRSESDHSGRSPDEWADRAGDQAGK